MKVARALGRAFSHAGRTLLPLLVAQALAAGATAQWTHLNPVTKVEQQDDGVLLTMKSGIMKLQICTPAIVRVLYSPGPSFPVRQDDVVISGARPPVHWTTETSGDSVVVLTPALRVIVSRSQGSIIFTDSSGGKLFQDNSRSLTPVEVNGEKTYHSEMFSNLWGSGEAFYGLGQHQAGVWNFRGESVDISQENTNIAIPFFLSTNGYGIFWNNSSRSRFNNRFLNALYLSSEVADAIDYYFIAGPEFDSIIAGYRTLTGGVPLFGKWAYGFWQCKNRYKTQDEILDVARKYRALHIPADNIVQDWFWWNTMGEPVFDASRYPDPGKMVEDLHASNFHLMISVWPYFRPGSSTYSDMERRGFFIDKTIAAAFHPEGQALYDAFNPEARKYYWHLMDTALFRIGVDAWWLDTTEPETEGRETNILVTNRVAGGSGARYANLFPLFTTSAVYEGQRHESERKRVFILSRSAYAGSQRNATAVWSGDINSDWVFFRKQIPAGLNCSLSGIPYWTTDTGGFITADPDDPLYRELFIRWFQFSTFCPILRVHGTRSNNQNELWSYGTTAQKILTDFDRLRYRLLPYIYTMAWRITSEGYTPMRGLVMNFRTDARAANTGDQFMFGDAFLVNPVTEPGANTRRLYLPRGPWFDFWSGSPIIGGRSVDAAAPIDRLPLFVRAGSIIPLGPDIEWAMEKPADPIELRVYRGASGDFTLYEDEGDSYDYEKGAYALIPFHWDDARQVLSIGERRGRFPGMRETRVFRVVFVSRGRGTGIQPTERPDRIVRYSGGAITLRSR
ncbi:MAG TPA: TIM-barrel domain-containing protein [Bacteroidota bacterium]